jgi:phosphate transport system protein
MVDHTVKAYDKELDALGRRIAEMGGIAEKMVIEAMDALANADTVSRTRSSRPIRASTRCSAKSRIWR